MLAEENYLQKIDMDRYDMAQDKKKQARGFIAPSLLAHKKLISLFSTGNHAHHSTPVSLHHGVLLLYDHTYVH